MLWGHIPSHKRPHMHKRTVQESVSIMERMSWSAFTSRARGCSCVLFGRVRRRRTGVE